MLYSDTSSTWHFWRDTNSGRGEWEEKKIANGSNITNNAHTIPYTWPHTIYLAPTALEHHYVVSLFKQAAVPQKYSQASLWGDWEDFKLLSIITELEKWHKIKTVIAHFFNCSLVVYGGLNTQSWDLGSVTLVKGLIRGLNCCPNCSDMDHAGWSIWLVISTQLRLLREILSHVKNMLGTAQTDHAW